MFSFPLPLTNREPTVTRKIQRRKKPTEIDGILHVSLNCQYVVLALLSLLGKQVTAQYLLQMEVEIIAVSLYSWISSRFYCIRRLCLFTRSTDQRS
jgi:hypothetical protein